MNSECHGFRVRSEFEHRKKDKQNETSSPGAALHSDRRAWSLGKNVEVKMRIVKEIEIEGKRAMALFDTGSVHTYVSSRQLEGVPIRTLSEPYKVALGGRIIEVTRHCSVQGKIEGLLFHTEVIPVDEVGKVDGKVVDVLIGALTMEEWEIIPNPKDGTLDLSGLKRREFTEF